jgi:gliding motility-associated-like protein
MKKVTLTLLLLCSYISLSAQVLNQPANWPNANWQVTGTFNTDPTAFEADPTVTSNFAFDDDDAGLGSDDDIFAESPVIDLSAAFTAAETWIFMDVDYVYNALGDVLRIEYWDADSSTWLSWEVFEESTNVPNDNFCTPAKDPFTSIQLNIAGFTATQLSGFRYRLAFYDDGPGGGAGFEWGFCFDSPTLRSETPPTCPVVTNIAVANITDTSAEISWNAGGSETEWEVVVQPVGTGVPTGNGTSTTTNPYTASPLSSSTAYEVYVRAVCSTTDFSNWEGPIEFTTENTPPPPPVGVTCGTGSSSFIYTAEFDTFDGWTGDITNTNQDGFWEIPGASGSFGTGPDNAFSGANYMNYESSGGVTNTASAVSPAIDLSAASDGAELSFYMHAFGADMGTLNVGVANSPSGPFTTLFTWIGEFQTSGAQDWVPIGINLDAYLGQTIYIEFSHTGTGGFEGDMSIDFMRVETCGTFCIAPSSLNASNITATSADISWIGNNGETSWEYVIQPAGTGVPTGPGTMVTTNAVSETTLSPSTDYEVYVLANCTSGNSSWAGPLNFTTDIQTDFVLDCTNGGPVTQDYCYDDGGATDPVIFTFTSNDGTPLNLNFNSGFVEDGWDELVVLDSNGTPFPGFAPADDNYGNGGNIGGLSFQSTGDTISFYVNSDGIFSCASGDSPMNTGINYTVACATCINPQATYTIVDDCDNGEQFLIDVNVTDLGDATSLTISNNINGDTIDNVTTPGTYQVGPFPFLQDVIVTISNDQDGNCVINSQPFQLLACPPDNDNPCGAIVASVNDDESCAVTTPGTILAATPSGVPSGSCTGDPDDDVWFEFVALGEQQIIQILNITGGTFNLDHGLYEGTCDNLSEIYCSADDFSLTPALTIGNTYYVRVFSAGSDDETSNFDLCISTLGEPTFCLDALPICADPDIQYPSVVGDQVAPPYLDYDCLGSQPDPQWNTILFDEAGDYQFSLDQVSETGVPLDIDFIIWGPFLDQQDGCVGLIPENIADCSFSATASETINLNNVPANSIYIILITNFSQQPGSYTFTQDSGPTDGTNCQVVCDVTMEVEGAPIEDDNPELGVPDEILNYCGFDSVTLEATTFYDVDQYIWYLDGFAIDGATSSTHTATESGTYQVQVLGGICDQSEIYLSALVQINFYDDPGNVEPQSISACDVTGGDGIGDFDLDALTESLGFGTDFTVSYYTSIDDANQAINPVSSPYTGTDGEVLVIRIEDTDALNDGFLGCRELSEVELIVTPAAFSASISTDVFYYNAETGEFLWCPESESGIVLTAVLNGITPQEISVEWLRDGVTVEGENGLSIGVSEPGDYTAIITEIATGCPYILEDVSVVEFENCVIPQGISPGVSVGQNDTFDLRFFDVRRLEIFNRYGTLVYSKDNYKDEWVGQTNDGDELPVGTYFYSMLYEGGAKTKTGWIYINR